MRLVSRISNLSNDFIRKSGLIYDNDFSDSPPAGMKLHREANTEQDDDFYWKERCTELWLFDFLFFSVI